MRQSPFDDVLFYLHQVKELIANGSIEMPSTYKNRVTSAKLGISSRDQLDILRALMARNYYGTYDPLPDKQAEAWAFGAREQGMDIYIKFVIEERTDTHDVVVCISFHEAEFPLRYPYGAMGESEGE